MKSFSVFCLSLVLAVCSAAPKAKPDLCGNDNCDDWQSDGVAYSLDRVYEKTDHRGSDSVADQVNDGLVYHYNQLEGAPDCTCRGFKYLEEAECCWSKLCHDPESYVRHHTDPEQSLSQIRFGCSMAEITGVFGDIFGTKGK